MLLAITVAMYVCISHPYRIMSFVNELACLKYLIRAQLADDLAYTCFDIGYVQNNKIISLRSKDDVIDLMSSYSVRGAMG